MNLRFTESKYIYIIIIILLIIISIFLPNGLKGYTISLIYFICAYINKRKKISIILFPSGFPKYEIRNLERFMKFEKIFFITIGISILFGQILINFIPKISYMVVASGIILLNILFIVYAFVKIE